MRSMENTKLVDSLEIPLKSFTDLVTALRYILDNGLSVYLEKFFVPLAPYIQFKKFTIMKLPKTLTTNYCATLQE